MIEWKDEVKNGKVVSSTAKVNGLKFVVHHWIGYGEDQWFASCYGLFEREKLHPKDIALAKIQATAKLQLFLEDCLDVILDGV